MSNIAKWAIKGWRKWRNWKCLARACPDHARLARERADATRRHKAARELDARLRASMTDLLRG